MPLAIPLFGFGDAHYGVFAGLVVYAVPQVLAATAPVSAVAVQSATLVKLMRVLMLGPLMLTLSMSQYWLGKNKNSSPNTFHPFKLVPWFIIGFGLLMGLRSMGLIPSIILPWLAASATILTNLSMAALGLSCDMRALACSGGRVIGAAILSLCTLIGMAALFCCFFI